MNQASLGLPPGHVSICARSRKVVWCGVSGCESSCVLSEESVCVVSGVKGEDWICDVCVTSPCVVVSCPVWCGSCAQKACVFPPESNICTVSSELCSPVPDLALASIVCNSGSKGYMNSRHECITCITKTTKLPKPNADTIMSCYTCKSSFHTECAEQFGPKSSLIKIVSLSKKFKNFSFYCEPCQNLRDLASADVQNQRVERLEGRLAMIEEILQNSIPEVHTKLEKLVSNIPQPSLAISPKPADANSLHLPPHDRPTSSNWVTPDENLQVSFLIPAINKSPPLSAQTIGEIANSNKIPLFSTTTDLSGRTYIKLAKLHLASFRGLIDAAIQSLPPTDIVDDVTNPSSGTHLTREITNKSPTITFVGLKQKYNKEEFFESFKGMNLHTFGSVMTPENFKVLSIHATKNDPLKFQAICSVSDSIRTILLKWGDKPHFASGTLLVYDHFHVRRCYNCQGLNHSVKNKSGEIRCTSPAACAFCAGNHSTSTCQHEETPSLHNCINCSSKGISTELCKHRADSSQCPTYISAQKKLKSQIPWYNNNKNTNNNTNRNQNF